MPCEQLSLKGFIAEMKEVTDGFHPRKFCFVLGAVAQELPGSATERGQSGDGRGRLVTSRPACGRDCLPLAFKGMAARLIAARWSDAQRPNTTPSRATWRFRSSQGVRPSTVQVPPSGRRMPLRIFPWASGCGVRSPPPCSTGPRSCFWTSPPSGWTRCQSSRSRPTQTGCSCPPGRRPGTGAPPSGAS